MSPGQAPLGLGRQSSRRSVIFRSDFFEVFSGSISKVNFKAFEFSKKISQRPVNCTLIGIETKFAVRNRYGVVCAKGKERKEARRGVRERRPRVYQTLLAPACVLR